MNMIVSQTIRRDDPVDIPSTALKYSQNLGPCELAKISPRSSRRNIHPWKIKKRIKNKENLQLYFRPSVADIFQNKYRKMYRGENIDKREKHKCMEINVKIEDADDSLLEGDEFPYKYRQSKPSNLHVSWEDESPLATLKVEETPNAEGLQQCHSKGPYSPDIMTGETNHCLERTSPDTRFNELYSEDKLPDHNDLLGMKPHKHWKKSQHKESSQEKTSKNISEPDFISNDSMKVMSYSSEMCFLNPIESFVNENIELKSKWDKYKPEEKNSEEKYDSDPMSLSGDLVDSDNANLSFGLTHADKTNSLIFVEDPVSSLTDITEFPLSEESENDNVTYFHNHHSESCNPAKEVKQKENIFSDLFKAHQGELSMTREEGKRKCYLTDPDDLLRTPPQLGT